jgi:hypothetical protein
VVFILLQLDVAGENGVDLSPGAVGEVFAGEYGERVVLW